MAMDLIIRRARLGDGKTADIGIRGGIFAAVEQRLDCRADREIDAGGKLATPPFADPHLHLDAVLTVGSPRYNASGTLLEGIAIWGERRPGVTKEEILRNAREAVLWEAANGVQFIRTHADTTDPSLVTVEALLELKDECGTSRRSRWWPFPGTESTPSPAVKGIFAGRWRWGATASAPSPTTS